jgi:hypothetical protein
MAEESMQSMTLILQPIGCPIVFLGRIIPKPVIRCLRLYSLPGHVFWDGRWVFGPVVQDEFHVFHGGNVSENINAVNQRVKCR